MSYPISLTNLSIIDTTPTAGIGAKTYQVECKYDASSYTINVSSSYTLRVYNRPLSEPPLLTELSITGGQISGFITTFSDSNSSIWTPMSHSYNGLAVFEEKQDGTKTQISNKHNSYPVNLQNVILTDSDPSKSDLQKNI